MMRAVGRSALLAPAFALATVVLGWWSVALLGAAWGAVLRRAEHPVRTAAVGAGLGWGILLLWTASVGPVWDVARRVGPVVTLPGWLFVVLTLLFPALLAASAAAIGAALRSRWKGR